ncbi:Uu.00g020690.m01.CDS01 [Anthostomella pinea]|uniref:Uu.00g020690.m01.CDS01 n=1 Tax=Anthostomella pinea TaxID=933095 RepID=A0AAI8W0F8_9PEZI|nr:Uu.00g020690.m01.CDS01 [Anthostomella pinea]
MRKATLQIYEQEIDDLYRAVELAHDGPPAGSNSTVNLNRLRSVVEAVQTACKESTTVGAVDMDEELLARGVDSLQVLSDDEARRKSEVEKTLGLFINRIDQLAEAQSHVVSTHKSRDTDPHVCIITGTTGYIGSYILRSLMQSTRVGTIYCLDRGSDSASRQRIHNAEVDEELPTAFADTVHFLEEDLTHETFGLEPGMFQAVSSSATLIIHTAWPVDFNLLLSSFIEHLVGVKNLCNFSAQCPLRPDFMFLSSVSAVMNLAFRPGTVLPEEIIEDLSAPVAAGYGESKYLAERMLDHAVKKLHIPATVVRIGSVCGATLSPGRWNPKEWLPRLIMGSFSLGVIPDSLGDYDPGTMDVTWLPIDVLADVLVEIAMKERAALAQGRLLTGAPVYHLMNPERTSWRVVLPSIVEALRGPSGRESLGESRDGRPVAVGPRLEWLNKLRAVTTNLGDLGSAQEATPVNPALKLVDFYEEKLREKVFPQWEMANAISTSHSLQEAGSVIPPDMEKWIRIWWDSEGMAV